MLMALVMAFLMCMGGRVDFGGKLVGPVGLAVLRFGANDIACLNDF